MTRRLLLSLLACLPVAWQVKLITRYERWSGRVIEYVVNEPLA